MKTQSGDENATLRLAAALSADLAPGDVVLLHGKLGAGKSVFARALIRTLMKDPDLEVPSPTFTLLQIYEAGIAPLYHYDFYRLENPDEVLELSWEDAQGSGIIIAEWPERIAPYLPARRLDIYIQAIENEPDTRQIQIDDKRGQ